MIYQYNEGVPYMHQSLEYTIINVQILFFLTSTVANIYQ